MAIDLDNLNDVEISVGQFQISCKGKILSSADAEPIGVDDEGGLLTEMQQATMVTVGGTCTDSDTGEEQIFPAGVYVLGSKDGIMKIGEIDSE